ncbi:Uncharacterised protein [Legionella bozemanae]|nr:Uncharacterised protein [Legionella bozemanae]
MQRLIKRIKTGRKLKLRPLHKGRFYEYYRKNYSGHF